MSTAQEWGPEYSLWGVVLSIMVMWCIA